MAGARQHDRWGGWGKAERCPSNRGPGASLRSAASHPCGVTLIEMLVVISILMLLAAIALRQARPAMESRRIREAARGLNVYFGAARVKAKETGRPHGVMLERWNVQSECSILLRQVEVPPPYAGDTFDAACQVQLLSVGPLGFSVLVQFSPAASVDLTLINAGDQIQFDHQGPLYRITAKDVTLARLTAELVPSYGQRVPWPAGAFSARAMPFEIIRQPVPSSAAPLQLPQGAVIDLYESGTNSVSFEPVAGNPTAPIIVMFSPSGSVQDVLGAGVCRTDPMFFLVGRADRVPLVAAAPATPRGPTQNEDGMRNYQDTGNLWVTLNPQTGLITTIENAAVVLQAQGQPRFPTPPTTFDYATPAHRLWALSEARNLARTGQSMGGR